MAEGDAEEAKQRLRLRRFLQASLFSILYLVVLGVFHMLGKVDQPTLIGTAAIVLTAILGFFAVFRLGFNRHFPDPSLTVFQLLSAVFTMIWVLYRAPETRLAFTAFFFVAVMFGMLRCSSRKLIALGVISLVAFAAMTGARYAGDRDPEMLRLDVLQFVVLAVTLPWLIFLGGRIKRLQKDLQAVNIKLGDIEEVARHDDLTGLYNRRALLAAMEDYKQRAVASGEPLSLCMIDLDFFKRYNDEFDHLTGDRVLKEFALAVCEGLRSSDVFGRYGGEEFVQILPNTALGGAVLDAERLRTRISVLDLAFASSLGPLTVSVGVAEYRPGEPILDTFARADAALYKAKRRGRNRVEC